MYYNSIEKN